MLNIAPNALALRLSRAKTALKIDAGAARMSDFDLDRLGDVWRQQPDPGGDGAAAAHRRAVSRRARWRQVVDVVGGDRGRRRRAVLSSCSIRRATPWSSAARAILLLLGSNIRLRKLRQVELAQPHRQHRGHARPVDRPGREPRCGTIGSALIAMRAGLPHRPPSSPPRRTGKSAAILDSLRRCAMAALHLARRLARRHRRASWSI